jgi:hypothetical protein
LQESNVTRYKELQEGTRGAHRNVRTLFYRLPEAMVPILELQSPITTSLAPRDIVDCFIASLWDEGLERIVSYRDARNMIQTRS